MKHEDKPFKQPKMRRIDDDNYLLEEDYIYYWTKGEGKFAIRVFKGFESDIASIPKGFRWLIPRDGSHRAAAVLHDWGYMYRGSFPKDSSLVKLAGKDWVNSPNRWRREHVDQLFKRVMIEADVPKWRVYSMYWAVRMFGKSAWDS